MEEYLKLFVLILVDHTQNYCLPGDWLGFCLIEWS
jgi:hypothetical protein